MSEKSGTKINRRKLRNVVVDRGAQLRFAAPYVALFLFSTLFIVLIAIKVSSGIALVSGQAANVDGSLFLDLRSLEADVFTWALGGILGLGIVTLLLWIVQSHRIFGPMVPMRRFITAIEEGRVERDFELRKDDEFKDILVALKRLQQKLIDEGRNK